MNTRKKLLVCIQVGLFPLVLMGFAVYLMLTGIIANIPIILALLLMAFGWVLVMGQHIRWY